VEVWLCRKTVLDRQVACLEGFGLEVSRVGVVLPEAPGRLAFAFLRHGNARGWSQAHLRALLLGSAVLCLLAAIVAAGAVATWKERGLRHAAEALAVKHRQVAPLATRQARLQAIDEALSRAAVPPLSSVLDELARVTPREAWLTQLQYQSGQVKVTGRSSDPGAVLPALRNSRLFKDARMDVVNAMNAGSDGAATFELTLTVVPLR
jgi:Tfp pilus assembly protein PilN